MNPHATTSPTPRRKFFAPAALSTLLIAACAVLVGAGMAQSAKQEREFKNTIPEHAPIKVKLKNEQSFKKLDNKDWARELEVEVKNIGSRPIYYLYVILVMRDLTPAGHPLSLRTIYGRRELAFLETPIEPDDVPILPGESVILKFPEKQVEGYEKWRAEKEWRDPKKVEFEIQIINFGDGTGLRGPGAVPDSIKKPSANALPGRKIGGACPPAPRVADTGSPGRLFKALYLTNAREFFAG